MRKSPTFLALLLAVASSLGCGVFGGRKKNPPQTTSQDLAAARAKADLYLSLASKAPSGPQDKYGFVHTASDQAGNLTEKCDALGFSCLYKLAGGQVDINQALDPVTPGKYYRHAEHDCYPAHSGSSMSRDHILMCMQYFWHAGATTAAEDIIHYADSHGGNIGGGDPFRINLLPPLYATLKAIVARAANTQPPPKEDDKIDPSQTQGGLGAVDLSKLFQQTGYEAHLTVEHILLRALVWGGVTDDELRTLKAQVDRQPRNALYQAIYHRYFDGDQTAALAVLADETLFPSGRLPTGSDRCEEFLFQRDQDSKDWQPCADNSPWKGHVHSGTDYLYTLKIVAGELRQASP